ncbi:ClpXP protease specificity-enhancing factor [Undibacterium flavidum]|uniref:ClpXP protease specificity-enhancing factor n=1 Tax=Undibacterium flavidum TaxID=2762297 RepID=A0ABR6Y7K9_9BURK|nr:ClpXP protease specificity-enhancing factor [Undibacterium flavidum]MBC3872605.1 ClpXP protease specificity-enhancing factor [Undibacterium flavidum]
MSGISTKPYLLRAIYEWCTDNGFTPYLSVKVSGAVQVPMEFVRKGEIVLNVAFSATSGLKMDNEAVTFKARFGGVSRDIYVPVANVQAIFASENGQGMVFDEVEIDEAPAPEVLVEPAKPVLGLASVSVREDDSALDSGKTDNPEKNQKKSEKPSLKVIK